MTRRTLAVLAAVFVTGACYAPVPDAQCRAALAQARDDLRVTLLDPADERHMAATSRLYECHDPRTLKVTCSDDELALRQDESAQLGRQVGEARRQWQQAADRLRTCSLNRITGKVEVHD